MNRALSASIILNIVMLVTCAYLWNRGFPTRDDSSDASEQEEKFTIPGGPDGGPSRLAVVVCKTSDDPHSVVSRVLARKEIGGTPFEVDIYATENESVGSVVNFLKVLAAAGVSDSARTIVSTSSGPVALDGFNLSPKGAFRDLQEFKDTLKE